MIKGRIKRAEEYGQEHNNRITDVISDFDIRESKVVILDADSLLFISSYTGKDEEGNKLPDYTREEYHVAEGILHENLLRIYSDIEQYFDIERVYICVKGRNNFRYEVFSDYKANRPVSLPIIAHLRNYLIEEHSALAADGYEADDLCFTISEMIGHRGIICTPDKDLGQIASIQFDYCKNIWKKVTEEEAKYAFARQMLTGDSGDGINFTPGHGPKYADRVIKKGMCDFGYLRQIVIVFKKCWQELWKEKLKLAYSLLKLHRVEPNFQELKQSA